MYSFEFSQERSWKIIFLEIPNSLKTTCRLKFGLTIVHFDFYVLPFYIIIIFQCISDKDHFLGYTYIRVHYRKKVFTFFVRRFIYFPVFILKFFLFLRVILNHQPANIKNIAGKRSVKSVVKCSNHSIIIFFFKSRNCFPEILTKWITSFSRREQKDLLFFNEIIREHFSIFTWDFWGLRPSSGRWREKMRPVLIVKWHQWPQVNITYA